MSTERNLVCWCDPPQECRILVSRTEKNPGRKFAKCPDGTCRMFGWLDEIEQAEEPTTRNPVMSANATTTVNEAKELVKRAEQQLDTLKRARDEMANKLEKMTHSYAKLEGDYKSICDINKATLAKNKELAAANALLEKSVELFSDDVMTLSTAGKKISVEPYMCKICFDHVITMIVYPCRHAAMCKGCVEELNKQKGASCPFCRTKIVSTGSVFVCP